MPTWQLQFDLYNNGIFEDWRIHIAACIDLFFQSPTCTGVPSAHYPRSPAGPKSACQLKIRTAHGAFGTKIQDRLRRSKVGLPP